MTQKKILSPFDYELKTLSLESSGGEIYDLRELFINIDIYESMMMNLSGVIGVADISNIVDELPIIAGENIVIEFNTNTKETIKYSFVISGISEQVDKNENSKVFLIDLVTPFYFDAVSKSVSRHFDTSLKNVLNDLLDTDVNFNGVGSENVDVIIHSANPYDASFSIVRKMDNIPDILFENRDGYHCYSIDYLLSQPPIREFTRNMTQYSDENNINNRLERSYNNIIDMEGGGISSALIKMSRGLDSSELSIYNPFNKKMERMAFDVSDQNVVKNTGGKFVKNSNNTKRLFHINTNGDINNTMNVLYQDVFNGLIDYRKHSIIIHGDSDIKVGDIIKFNPPSTKMSGGQEEKTLSGNWLITNLKHTLSNNTYSVTMDIAKNSINI